nr:uncharacterized protein LOC124810063 [Hydra vulgaris]
MAYTCVVIGCKNTNCKLKKWDKEMCQQHGCVRSEGLCTCLKPFLFNKFPNIKKNAERRDQWLKLINRKTVTDKLWQPSKDACVCSIHFTDSRPTDEHPNPTINLGYDSKKREALFSPVLSKRRFPSKQLFPFTKKSRVNSVSICHEPENAIKEKFIETSSCNLKNDEQGQSSIQNESLEFEDICFEYTKNDRENANKSLTIQDIFVLIVALVSTIHTLLCCIQNLHSQIEQLKKNLKEPIFKKLLNENNCKFYTNIAQIELFHKLHDKIMPLIKRRLPQNSDNVCPRLFKLTPQKMGPKTKINSIDEFLLTLMKLRLGLLNKDLADRFGVSEGLCSKIFHSWIRGMSEYFKNFIFMPDMGAILATTPQRYKKFDNLSSIIDCSEIFIETPKNLALQSVTWSDYKHHNTLKFLISIAPNSSITFISKAYTGRISDKKITIDSKFLDILPKYSTLMADKGFSLYDECAARSLYFLVPPGKRGATQMTPGEIKKTSNIAKVRILVEQVIRRLKTFKIIANEIPISMLSHVDDILVVCAALYNFKKPIYSD